MNIAALNEAADAVHELAKAKGWHEEKDLEKYISNTTSNIHGETSELWEAFRSGTLDKPCDKADKMAAAGVPVLTCAEEELADIIIRAFDTARHLKVDIGRAIAAKHAFNATRPYRHGGKKA